MVKYCPSCGAEVKEGSKFCLGCGAQLQAEASAPQAAQTPPPVAPVPPPQQPVPQQAYAPVPPKKTNMKLIGGIIAIIVAIVIVVLVVFLFIGGATSNDFVGTWEVQSITEDGETDDLSGSDVDITFQSDGTYTASGATGTWEFKNNKLYIISSSGSDEYDDLGLDYEFSNNKNSLTLSFSGIANDEEYHTMTMVLTKT